MIRELIDRNPTVLRPAGRRGHVLPYGTARISHCSVVIVQSVYGAIQEYVGIDRAE